MRDRRFLLTAAASIMLLLFCVLASIACGSKSVGFPTVIRSLFHLGEETFENNVVQARIPRTVFGILAGASLSVSGALMQAVTRNPIADPSILGVNTGASLFVVCGIAFFHISKGSQYIWLAFAGAALTAVLVYGLASIGGNGATPIKLALAGAAAGTALQSLVNTVMLPSTQVMDQFRFWQTGSVGGANWADIRLLCPYFIVGFVVSICMAAPLNTLALGDEAATGLGLNVPLTRALASLAGVLLCASTTALAGPISFVGLMVPHLFRMVLGPDMKKILPMSAIGGAILLLFADTMGRILGRPGELESGIVTALIGSTCIYHYYKKGKGKVTVKKNLDFSSMSAVEAGYRRRQRKSTVITLVLAVLVLMLAAFMMLYGNTIYTPRQVWDALNEVEGSAVFTVKTLRLPRMLTAILAGFAFGMAGNTFQQLLGNPLASPDIIGVTSGASVAAVFGILVLKLPGSVVSLLAVASGLLVSCLIYLLAQGGGFSNARLILTGIGMQAFLNAIVSWLLLKASEYDVASALRWLSGSLNGVKLENVPLLAVVVIAASCMIVLLDKQLAMLQMGESHAVTLGVKSKMVRLALILLSLLLVAFATSVTGPIASVAFLAGPIAARLCGGGRTNMLASALVGSVLVLASDLIGQFALPSRYPVGVVTGILGAPYLIFLLLRMNKKSETV